ncbi:MAG: ACT domain-containing protein [Anaerolineae bacterium]
MTQSALEALRGAQWYLDDQVYGVARLSSAAVTAAAAIIAEQERPFHALIVDKDEVTLVAPLDLFQIAAQRFAGLEIGSVHYRLVTLEVVFALDVVGIIAQIAPALAQAGIPILAISSFSRDHFLVPSDRANEALNVLRALSAI